MRYDNWEHLYSLKGATELGGGSDIGARSILAIAKFKLEILVKMI
jgi:hypothetical protein